MDSKSYTGEARGEEGMPELDFPPDASTVIDVSAPLSVARAFIDDRAGKEALPDTVYWQGEFWRTRRTHYAALPVDALKSDLYRWLERQKHVVDGQTRHVKPNKRMVDGIVDALQAAAYIDVPHTPVWLTDHANLPDPAEMIACANGLLHIPTRKLLPLSRAYFNFNAVDFPYDPSLPEPEQWHSFLDQLWHDDVESIAALQELFGYALTTDSRFQKMFLLIGPRRSGKGTLTRILRDLVGTGNTTAPTLHGLGQPFGRQPLIGKTLALIGDARMGARADVAAIVETLLSITGEDAVNVPRKFLPEWTARLPVRFVILTNELPAFLDQSGALASRFIVLRLTESFLGREDLALYEKLRDELPAIFAWALVGLDRLRDRGHFLQPKSATEMVRQLETLSSPIKSFVADRCITSPAAEIETTRLFKAWQEWAQEQGRDHAGTFEVFSRNLTSAFTRIQRSRHRVGGQRVMKYHGIRLRDITDPDPEE